MACSSVCTRHQLSSTVGADDKLKVVELEKELESCKAKNLILEKELKLEIEEKKHSKTKHEKICDALKIESENLSKNLLDQLQKAKHSFNEKNEEIKVLKSVIKKNGDEIAKNKSESKEFSKLVRSKEKEIHNLENKAENLAYTLQNLKDKNNMLKNEVKKLEKAKNRWKTFLLN